jgi:hypothetical protein
MIEASKKNVAGKVYTQYTCQCGHKKGLFS